MSKRIWQKLNSLEIIPFVITLWAYDGFPSQIECLFQKVPIDIACKAVLVDIKFIDTPLDYNVLLGRSYMYTNKAMASSMFCTMIFLHNGKVIMIDQLTHYEPHPFVNLDDILPLIEAHLEISLVMEMGP